MIGSFWSTKQVELLNRKKWKPRPQLANAHSAFSEIYYNRPRRHSAQTGKHQTPSSNARSPAWDSGVT
jgi:hypothetical protein